jgi:hypothetical protein
MALASCVFPPSSRNILLRSAAPTAPSPTRLGERHCVLAAPHSLHQLPQGRQWACNCRGRVGGGCRRARGTAGACGMTHPPRKAAGGKAPQDRRRLIFFWGGAEMRRSRLWSLKSVLDALRMTAASCPSPRPSRPCTLRIGQNVQDSHLLSGWHIKCRCLVLLRSAYALLRFQLRCRQPCHCANCDQRRPSCLRAQFAVPAESNFAPPLPT